MELLLQGKEKYATLQQDWDELSSSKDMNYRRRFALIYRIEKKKILYSNIDLAKFVLKIL